MRPFVSVVIPAYNEAAIIPVTVAALQRSGTFDEIVVIDDGSRDGTAATARRAGARVVRFAENRGKGAALNVGITAAHGDIVVLLDADLGESAAEADKLVAPVVRDEADLVIAAFPTVGGRSGFGLVQTMARLAVRTLAGLDVRSPLSGQRAIRRRVLDGIGALAGGFGVEVGLTIDAARAGYRVIEVPVAMEHRRTGRDLAGFLHRGRQFVHVAGALVPRFLRYRQRVRR